MPGNDTNTKLLLHFNNNSQDSSLSQLSLSGSGSGFVTSPKVFGSHAIRFNNEPFANVSLPLISDLRMFDNNSDTRSMDFWINFQSLSGSQVIWTELPASALHNNHMEILWEDNHFEISGIGSGGICSHSTNDLTSIISPNIWYHILLVRLGSTVAFYVDGQQVSYDTNPGTSIYTISCAIGWSAYNPQKNLNAYLDEFRIQHTNYFNVSPNVSLTDIFVIPTEEYKGIVSAPQNLNVNFISPTELDVDWDTPFDQGDSSITGYKIERKLDTDLSFTTIVADTGNTNTIYHDTGLLTDKIYIYRISGINSLGTGISSIASGSTSLVYLMLHLNGANNSTTSIKDASPRKWAVGINGDTKITTANYQFGNSSLVLDGNGDFLTCGNLASDFKFLHGAEDTVNFKWTIDFWIRKNIAFDGQFRVIMGNRNLATGSVGFSIYFTDDNRIVFQISNTTTNVIVGGNILGNFPDDTNWHYLKVTYDNSLSSNNMKYFLDGVLVSQHTKIGTPTTNDPNGVFRIGGRINNSQYFNGNLDEVRFLKDITDNSTGIPTDEYSTGKTTEPQNLDAITTRRDEITLTWDSPLSNGGFPPVLGYKIERKIGIGSYSTLVSDTTSTSTIYIDSGLSLNVTYTYRISAINEIGTSSPSNEDSATTYYEISSAPQNLNAVAFSADQIDLSWEAPDDDGGSPITGYKIERSLDGMDWDIIVADTGNDDTTYSDIGLDHTTLYYYRVAAINSAGFGEYASATETTFATTPTAPQNLTAVTQSSTEILLDWDTPADDGGSPITGYKIYVESPVGGGFIVLVANTMSTDTEYLDTGLSPNTEYNYKIRAINAIGEGSFSNEAAATTLGFVRHIDKLTGKMRFGKQIAGRVFMDMLTGQVYIKI